MKWDSREGSGFLCPDPQNPELPVIQRQEAPESSDSKPVLELQNEQTQLQQTLEECPPPPPPLPLPGLGDSVFVKETAIKLHFCF